MLFRSECGADRPDVFAVSRDGREYAVAFPNAGAAVTGELRYRSAIGEHEYGSFRADGGRPLRHDELVRFIAEELRAAGHDVTEERIAAFARKVENSRRNLALYLTEAASAGRPHPFDYIASEQSLLFGHPFHPYPKNTIGFSYEDVRAYSPELRTSFPLCWIGVRRDVYLEAWAEGAEEIGRAHV